MHIVLFGGSFNPPHLGHLIVIQQAFEPIPKTVPSLSLGKGRVDELWILPCYRHTFQKNLAPTKQRLKMSRLLIDELSSAIKSKVKLETIETDHRLSGETYEALQLLKEKYPNHTFTFLMGTDQLKDFKKWGNWRKLLEEMPFYIYPRSGYKNDINFPNMTLLESPTQVITNISSTIVRERIINNQTIDFIIPALISNYIRKNNLYR